MARRSFSGFAAAPWPAWPATLGHRCHHRAHRAVACCGCQPDHRHSERSCRAGGPVGAFAVLFRHRRGPISVAGPDFLVQCSGAVVCQSAVMVGRSLCALCCAGSRLRPPRWTAAVSVVGYSGPAACLVLYGHACLGSVCRCRALLCMGWILAPAATALQSGSMPAVPFCWGFSHCSLFGCPHDGQL